ncbi:amino acid ABC transporter periplasmic protein [Oleiphilus messinensis]|uniref:Amino acid ABC transporter periplasmic protein n=1 Tax=Oleiphilus messinensis TaxID=141451 RepID=A0A1Y0IHM2_9GAMM|nr:ABC transporter substrate-binding protein [Oleiphilus messinensis]ARU59055.1 amino acid ABC transporter periplasmic protein [Oleiphilus messinensis]
MKVKSYFSFAWLFLALATSVQADDHVRYSITEISWEPYWIIQNGVASGILHDVILELDARIEAEFIPVKPFLPVKRADLEFQAGLIQLDCCLNPDWRPSPANQAVTLWSDTVLTVNEILIFPKGKRFPYQTLHDLKDKKIATILGYGYVGAEYFTRSDSKDNVSQIQKIAFQRAHAGIIDVNEFNYMVRTHEVVRDVRPLIEIGPIINRSDLRVRIHQSRPELLGTVNVALRKIREEGVIDRIIARYTDEFIRTEPVSRLP